MTSERVLLCKRTGNLLIGHRVSLFDKGIQDVAPIGWCISFGYDGWIVNNTEASNFWWFMNREFVDGNMEELGTLG